MSGWIGVDLDGTLAHYEGWNGGSIGKPIAPMVNRVRDWLQNGREVRIFTARAAAPELIPAVQEWCLTHIGTVLPVTNVKDFGMVELWDDRAVQVVPNTGQPVGQSTRGLT